VLTQRDGGERSVSKKKGERGKLAIEKKEKLQTARGRVSSKEGIVIEPIPTKLVQLGGHTNRKKQKKTGKSK